MSILAKLLAAEPPAENIYAEEGASPYSIVKHGDSRYLYVEYGQWISCEEWKDLGEPEPAFSSVQCRSSKTYRRVRHGPNINKWKMHPDPGNNWTPCDFFILMTALREVKVI